MLIDGLQWAMHLNQKLDNKTCVHPLTRYRSADIIDQHLSQYISVEALKLKSSPQRLGVRSSQSHRGHELMIDLWPILSFIFLSWLSADCADSASCTTSRAALGAASSFKFDLETNHHFLNRYYETTHGWMCRSHSELETIAPQVGALLAASQVSHEVPAQQTRCTDAHARTPHIAGHV
jgi:hypothetical protein